MHRKKDGMGCAPEVNREKWNRLRSNTHGMLRTTSALMVIMLLLLDSIPLRAAESGVRVTMRPTYLEALETEDNGSLFHTKKDEIIFIYLLERIRNGQVVDFRLWADGILDVYPDSPLRADQSGVNFAPLELVVYPGDQIRVRTALIDVDDDSEERETVGRIQDAAADVGTVTTFVYPPATAVVSTVNTALSIFGYAYWFFDWLDDNDNLGEDSWIQDNLAPGTYSIPMNIQRWSGSSFDWAYRIYVSLSKKQIYTPEALVGDFNGDGRDDVALRKHGWSSIPAYFSNGNGTFSTVASYQAFNVINDPDARAIKGDFNGDGKTDVALRRSGWNSTPVYFSLGNGTFSATNADNGSFNVINDMAAEALPGDFNGDGLTDIALRRSGWNTTPVYFSLGNGSFYAKNIYNGAFNVINDMNAKTMVGDFNGDGRTDIALRRSGWNSTPVYFSLGDSFYATNTSNGTFNVINDMNAVVMPGDFNGDGLTDIALRRSGWNSTPIYYSFGDGYFYATNNSNGTFNVINDMNAEAMLGDFDGDGRSDIALRRSGWNSTPVYFSPRTSRIQCNTTNRCIQVGGTLNPTNASSALNVINDPIAHPLLGDFNGDGRSDIALWKPGWNSTPVYFSNGNGAFTTTNNNQPASVNWINNLYQ